MARDAKPPPSLPTVAGLVRTARLALASGDTATAVAQLAAAWAVAPSTRIGTLAHTLSARLPVTPIPGRTNEREARWLQLAAKHDPGSLPTLLAIDWPVHPRAAKARLELLLEFAPDPRIAIALRELWQARRYRSNSGYVFWRSAFKTLAKWRDPGIAPLVAQARKDKDIEWFAIFEKLAKQPAPGEPELSDAIADDLAVIEADIAMRVTTSPATREQLFEAVYDDPGSDVPRLVLADALLADGDPRGELIQLQLQAAPRSTAKARIKALLRASAAKWLDGLDGLVVDPVFRRGFVAEAGLSSARDWKPATRAWRTVETLRVFSSDHTRVLALLGHANLAQLTRIDGLPCTIAARYLATARHDLDRIEIHAPLCELGDVAIRIRELAISESYQNHGSLDGVLAWFERSAIASRVTSLVVDRFEDDLPAAFRWYTRSTLASLALRPLFVFTQPMAWELRLARDGDRDGDGTRLDATWHGRLFGERDPEGLGHALARLPDDALTSIVVGKGIDLAAPLRERFVAEIERGLAKQRRLVTRRLFE